MEKTIKQIKQDLESEAEKLELKCDFGTEDGYTWITLYDASEYGVKAAHPRNYEQLARLVADVSGHDFYAASVRSGSIEGALDCDLMDWDADENSVPKRHTEEEGCEIRNYGERFGPGEPGVRFEAGLPLRSWRNKQKP